MKASTDEIASFREDVVGPLSATRINVAGWPRDSRENKDKQPRDLHKGSLR